MTKLRNNLNSAFIPTKRFYRVPPLVNPGRNFPTTFNLTSDSGTGFCLAESPSTELHLRRLAGRILKAAALFTSLVLRVLAVLFDVEIRLVNWLTRPGLEHGFLHHKANPRTEGGKNQRIVLTALSRSSDHRETST